MNQYLYIIERIFCAVIPITVEKISYITTVTNIIKAHEI